jgi:ribosomal protein S18 acetylase RimI-like enzyme
MAYHITGLEPSHATDCFICGQPSLEQYLRQYARQDIRRRVSRVFVATVTENPQVIAGYYTLSAGSVKCSERPIHLGKKLPRYPIPVALLGRLAVATACQGQGLGAILLADACRRVHQASSLLGVYAILVDALNDQAQAFYRHHGFIALPNQLTQWLLPLTTMAQAMK